MRNTAAVVDVRADQSAATRILQAFQTRIGPDRFAVWFGDASCRIDAETTGEPPRVTLTVGAGGTHEWLRRMFRAEVEASVTEACGVALPVVWQGDERGDADVPQSKARAADVPKPARPASALAVVRASKPAAGHAVPSSASPACAASRRTTRSLAEFVVGPSNRMAFGAVEMAVARPGEMSPLVLHGPSGVGKTHLLEAMGERAREMHPGINAVCLSAEQFTTAFLQALHAGGLPGFRRTCRGADLLCIDDVQFFAGKKATLLELQHTVDAMLRQGRQVVLSCDRELDALPDLGADLQTRLRGGMVARILPPDYDVRRGIVASLCSRRRLSVPDDVIHYVATSMTRHARELFGAVNRLEATGQMLGIPVTLGMAEESLSDLVRSSARSVRLADVERAVCKAFGIDAGCLQSARRTRASSQPRMLAMYLARKHTQAALAEIGAYFGRRSHSTVIAAQKAIGEWVSKGSSITLADASWDVEEAIRRVEDVLRAG